MSCVLFIIFLKDFRCIKFHTYSTTNNLHDFRLGESNILEGLSEEQLLLGRLQPFWVPDADSPNWDGNIKLASLLVKHRGFKKLRVGNL